MTENKQQDIILYVPRSNQLTSILVGLICLIVGLSIPFLAGWQLFALLFSLLLIIGGIWLSPVLAWKLLHHPVLLINEEGVSSQHPMFSITLKWDEISATYWVNKRGKFMFTVDISPAGLLSFASRQRRRINKGIDIIVPQQALSISSTNLSIPVDEVLTQICERFVDQIDRYHIDCLMD
jgi:hypothetical protein